MDVDRLATQAVAKDSAKAAGANYIRGAGIRSSVMEHLVPEELFSISKNPAQGISAVKALSIANAQGQQIWTIDNNNLTKP